MTTRGAVDPSDFHCVQCCATATYVPWDGSAWCDEHKPTTSLVPRTDLLTLGETLRRLRELCNISTGQLARVLGEPTSVVSNWERDLVPLSTIDRLRYLSALMAIIARSVGKVD